MPQSVDSDPDSIQRISTICSVAVVGVRNTTHDRIAAKNSRLVVITCPAYSPVKRQPNPQIRAPISGANRMMVTISSALHHVYIFDINRPARAEE